MGFIIHFYIIFGTNLLTEGPVQIVVFCLFQCFAEKEYQTESKRNETFGRVIFGTEAIQKHNSWARRVLSQRKGGGCAQGGGRALLPRGLLASSLMSTPSPLDHVCSKNNSPEGFIPFGLRLIFLFYETLK